MNATATGDAGDDGVTGDGGVDFSQVSLIQGADAKISVYVTNTTGQAANLYAWIDWNGDGVWEATESVAFRDTNGNPMTQLNAGANTLFFTVPGDAVVGNTFARFRLSQQPSSLPTGADATGGEVEDYEVSILAPPHNITGTVYNDLDGDGVHDTGETGLAGWTVYIDANNNGTWDAGENFAITDEYGYYAIPNVFPGTYTVREDLDLQPGWSQTGSISHTVTMDTSGDQTGNDFFDRDTTPPKVVSIKKGNGVTAGVDPTNAAVVHFAVLFSEPVTGVDPTDFAIVAPLLTNTSIAGVTFHDGIYDVAVNTGAGAGSLQLKLVDDDSIRDLSGNRLGGTGTGNGNFTGPTYTIDHVAPTLKSIALASSTPSHAATVAFTVTFSEFVTGVDATDFSAGDAGLMGPFNLTVTGSGSVYTVTVSTGTRDGTLWLNLANDGSIVDAVGNALSGTPPPSPSYTIDKTSPTVVSIVEGNGVDPVVDPTNAAVVHFAVLFSKPVIGVNVTDFTLAAPLLTGASIAGVTYHDGIYDVAVNTGAGAGSLQLSLVDNDSIKDASSGNPLGGAGIGNGDFTGPAYTIDRIAPTLTSITLASPTPTNADTVAFTVTFSEAVTGVDATDFTAGVSGLTGTFTPVVTGSGAVYTVTLPTGAGYGSLWLNVGNDGTIADLVGNVWTDAPPASPSYAIDKIPPTVVSSVRAGASPTNAATVVFTVTFSENVTGVDTSDFALEHDRHVRCVGVQRFRQRRRLLGHRGDRNQRRHDPIASDRRQLHPRRRR